MEHIDGRSLDTYIELNSHQRMYGERTVAEIMLKLLKALNDCHQLGIAHREINPRNIIITEDEDVRLINFGLEPRVAGSKPACVLAKDPYYRAPEVFEGTQSTASDLWSLGVVLYQMVSGHQPFN